MSQTQGTYRVLLQKEQLVFSAAHFITFAGDICEHDDQKADASRWLEQIPVIQQFRRQVLK